MFRPAAGVFPGPALTVCAGALPHVHRSGAGRRVGLRARLKHGPWYRTPSLPGPPAFGQGDFLSQKPGILQ